MKRIATLAASVALLAPGAAVAQTSSTCQAYNKQLCTVAPHHHANAPLPFTGLDVALLAAGGGTLLGTGLVVRRISRRLY